MRPLRLALVLLALSAAASGTLEAAASGTLEAAAAEVAPEAATVGRPGGSTAPVGAFPTPLAGSFARVLAALALITGTGAGLAWWSRKRRGLIGTTAGRIQVLASRAIGPRHQVVLIEVGERRLLLGTAPESVRALADLSEVPPFAAQLGRELPEIERDLTGIGSFGDLHV